MKKNKKQEQFDKIQKELLMHKHRYYVLSNSIISDQAYDMLEEKSLKLARELGFKADKWENPDENEKHHIHWMVDFSENHPLSIELGLKDTRGKNNTQV